MEHTIGIDLGGTKVAAGLVSKEGILAVEKRPVRAQGSVEEVLEDIFSVLEPLDFSRVKGLGIGVPGTVDGHEGIVYDIQNIPSWREVPLRTLLEDKYKVPVRVNNDSNCFALGERIHGKGRLYDSFAGVTIGTGLGTGIIVDGHLYDGAHCGAGEFGMIPYRDHNLEYYASGSFFKNVVGVSGVEVFERAQKGEQEALGHYHQLGAHIGEALKTLMFALDPQAFILGGSVIAGFQFFEEAMRGTIATFPYRNVLAGLTIEVSDLEHSAILGAAGLIQEKIA